jgi:GAF domain-containing protein
MRGIPETFAEVLRQPRRAGPQTLFLNGERIVHIPDFAAEAPAVGDNRVYRAAVAAGIRTVLFVPLRSEQRLLGYITASCREVRPFSDMQIALLQNFAAQAVIAMENARLLTETREVLEQQTATAEVLGVINSSRGDLAPVFDAILGKALNLCAATCGGLQGYDGRYFHQLAMHGPQEIEEWGRGLGPIDPEPGTTIAEIVQGKGVVQVADMMKSKAYRNETSSGRRALVDIGGFQTIISIALRKDGVLRGALHVWRSELQPFSDKQIALLENFAAQAVIAMENTRLLGELRQRTEEVAELNRGLEARVAGQTGRRIGPRGSAEAVPRATTRQTHRLSRRRENP